MTALAAPRDTPRLGDEALPQLWKLPIDASVKIYAGSMCVINAGYVRPARASTTDLSAGVARQTYDNSSGSAGAFYVEVRRGVFGFGNSASTDAIAQADVGKVCYFVDDQTVAKTDGTGTRSIAGRIMSVSEGDSLVYVQLGALV